LHFWHPFLLRGIQPGLQPGPILVADDGQQRTRAFARIPQFSTPRFQPFAQCGTFLAEVLAGRQQQDARRTGRERPAWWGCRPAPIRIKLSTALWHPNAQ
jgi:hypothetical protein